MTGVIVRPVLCRPFVGRQEELRYLRERRLEASSSHGGLVLVAGEAGVGKSRLISEFCESLAYSRWRIGQGPCLEFAQRPYGPFLDILARIDSRPFEAGLAASRRDQFDKIIERFEAIAAKTALVLVIEDVHWADAATLDLLAYLGSKLHRMRILVLASYRPDDLHPEHPSATAVAKIARSARAGRIDLGPLRGMELRTFIDEALTGFALAEGTRREIALAGDGNPFFTEELLKSAVERRATNDGVRKRDMHATLRDTLLERLRPLDPEERRIVTQAAVIGRTFGMDLLATTLDVEPERLLPPLRRARDFQLVEEIAPAVFRFRHALTREAIYQSFLGAELRPRHRAIAGALEDAPLERRSLESLAYHWWAAGDAERAVRYNELAGDAAANVHAHENAIALYERALEFSDIEPIARASIVEKIAARRQALTWNAESRAAYNAAADIFRDARAYEREAGCRVFAAIQAYTLKLPAPTAPLEEMLTRLEPSEYLARSRVHLGLAWLAATLWFPSEAEAHMAEVDPRALAEAADIGLRYHNISAWVAMTIGDIDRFVREHAAWVESAKAMKSIAAEAGAHYNGAMCFSYFGWHERAREEIDRALRIARESDSAHARESAHAISAMCYLMSGDLERARAAVEAVPASTENRVNLTFAAAWGAFVGVYLDDEALIEKWFDRFETSFAASPDIDCGGSFAEIMVRRGRQRDAATLLSRAVPDCELMRGCITTLLAVAKYGDAADRNRAREHLARAAAGPHELPERPALALFEAYVLLREGRSQEAAAPALRAAEGFGRLRFPLLRAAALEAAGDAEAARTLFRDCGATYDVRRLDARVHSQPAFAPLVRASIALLSAREREIAALAAKGSSNLEIARELSISHKTVEKHLASVYQKLGVSSRTHLVAYLGAEQRVSEQRATQISTN